MKYRKKPVVIEAHQWYKNGDHPLDHATNVSRFESGELKEFSGAHAKSNDWSGQIVGRYRTPSMDGQSVCKHCSNIMHIHGWMDTLEGEHTVCPGDYIITGVKGEMYPCKPDIFEQTYDKVE